MNPFELYPLEEHVVPDAVNWSLREDGSYLRRGDGMIVRRAARGWEVDCGETNWSIPATLVGSMENVRALHHMDGRAPLDLPHPKPGQVWWVIDADGTPAAVMILGVAYTDPNDPTILPPEPFSAISWSRFKGETVVLVAGPDAPWAPTGWSYEAPAE